MRKLAVLLAVVWTLFSHSILSLSAQMQANDLRRDVRMIVRPGAPACQEVVHDPRLYNEGWQQLSQPRFWRLIMNLPEDSTVINVADTRQILQIIDTRTFNAMGASTKTALYQRLLKEKNLPLNAEIYATKGRDSFYGVENVLDQIDQVIDIFVAEDVDPWLAQAILLIESPSGNLRSGAGAYGAFQLMPDVARQYGLVVNANVDERKYLSKSARAAAHLLHNVCVPEVEKMLNTYHVKFDRNDIWFRLLVLHAYHAGAGNVRAVMARIQPKVGGMELMEKIWQTEAAAFRNESQNYSQIALAGIIEMDAYIYKNCKRGCGTPPPTARTVPVSSTKK